MNTLDNMKPYMNLSRELLLGAIEDLLYKENDLLKKNREYADTIARLHIELKNCSVDSPAKGTDEFPPNYSAILDSHQQTIDSLQNTLTMIAMANSKVRRTHQAEPDILDYTLNNIDTAKGTDTHHLRGMGPIIEDDSREEPNTTVGGYTVETPEFEVDGDIYSHIASLITTEAQKDVLPTPTPKPYMSTEWFRSYPYANYMPNTAAPSQQHCVFTSRDFPDGWLNKYPNLQCILGKYGHDLSAAELKIINDAEVNEVSVRIAP